MVNEPMVKLCNLDGATKLEQLHHINKLKKEIDGQPCWRCGKLFGKAGAVYVENPDTGAYVVPMLCLCRKCWKEVEREMGLELLV